jgi:hypothetical protein
MTPSNLVQDNTQYRGSLLCSLTAASLLASQLMLAAQHIFETRNARLHGVKAMEGMSIHIINC